MSKQIDLVLTPEAAGDNALVLSAIRQHLGKGEEIFSYRPVRRSIDARHRKILINLRVEVFTDGEEVTPLIIRREFNHIQKNKTAVIIGAGPAGLFAALRCIELGIKPVLIERGKDVRARRRDLVNIHRNHIVDSDSNYCFGEGGAGTYSDGKLYTRSTKRGDVRAVLETLVQFGASEEILVEAHPHIGTNKLPGIIASIREEIIRCGGEVLFNKRMTDLEVKEGKVKAVITADGDKIVGDAFILATGHSARDIFELLYKKNILIEFKPFAIGVRAEHPQEIIDRVQYHCDTRPDVLPPASYSLVHQAYGLGVYSFCMCPGGIIAPCATSQDEVVTNGWSPSKRNNPYANSGIVVPIHWEHIHEYQKFGPLAGLHFQKEVENFCWSEAGKTQVAPAQRMVDFINNRKSSDLPQCSYQPGIVSANLNQILPSHIAMHLVEGFKAFGKKMKGYLTNEAVLVAPESRTSSPVRIPRDKEKLAHPELCNLYPCGEGAGYAGGIISAALDGERVADALVVSLNS